MEVRGQLAGDSSLSLPFGSWGSNMGQACLASVLRDDPSQQPRFVLRLGLDI